MNRFEYIKRRYGGKPSTHDGQHGAGSNGNQNRRFGKVIKAGGTDLLDLIKEGVRNLVWIDLKNIPETG